MRWLYLAAIVVFSAIAWVNGRAIVRRLWITYVWWKINHQ